MVNDNATVFVNQYRVLLSCQPESFVLGFYKIIRGRADISQRVGYQRLKGRGVESEFGLRRGDDKGDIAAFCRDDAIYLFVAI